MSIRLKDVVDGYIQAALFSTNDESDDSGGEPLDANYSESDLSPRALTQIKRACALFVKQNRKAIEKFKDVAKKDDADVGHDFWFTRAGHGVGFWDRGAGEVGEKLTAAAKRFGEMYMYLGDDDKIHVSGGAGGRRRS